MAKVSVIEEFCTANYRFNNMLYKDMKLLEIDLPLTDVEQYYNDNNTGKLCRFNEDNEEKVEAEKRLKEYIWFNTSKHVQEMYSEPADREKYLNKKLTESIKRYDWQIDNIKKWYFDLFDKLSLQEMDYAFGKVDFMFVNKKYRKKLMYDAVLQKQRKLMQKLLEFKQLFADDKLKLTKVSLIKHIIEIQNLLFKEEKIEDLMEEDKINLSDILDRDDLEDGLVAYVLIREHEFCVNLILHRLLQFVYHQKDDENKPSVWHGYDIKYYYRKSES